MSHKRTDIRKACVESLKGQTIVGQNVIANRVAPLFEMELPVINVTGGRESAEPDTVSDATSLRSWELAIGIYIASSATLDDDLDSLAKQVEEVMALSDSLGPSAITCQLTDTTPELVMVGETLAGSIELVYTVTYLA